ncbi:hypothetical protein ACNUDN_29885 [Mycobacterium sp. smrl_JER01]|uniref:hypothetical protein n=1 Tax=Mycobacterium sp. smrl_JER01 TaxID=3402633 RepID=UPI003AC27405
MSYDDDLAAESGTPAYEAARAAAFRKLSQVAGEVDAKSLTFEQLQTIVLETNMAFGVPVTAEEASADQSGDGVAELQAALDRLSADALKAAYAAERRICDQIAALPDVDHDHSRTYGAVADSGEDARASDVSDWRGQSERLGPFEFSTDK